MNACGSVLLSVEIVSIKRCGFDLRDIFVGLIFFESLVSVCDLFSFCGFRKDLIKNFDKGDVGEDIPN